MAIAHSDFGCSLKNFKPHKFTISFRYLICDPPAIEKLISSSHNRIAIDEKDQPEPNGNKIPKVSSWCTTNRPIPGAIEAG
ncbi:hypothetical protein MCC01971_18540 [Bifidobacteriaceae bacterium MCC01971]|nr:hypothetical protein MCC01971_18540 [Bifidobacteriaceae bacterium MCC01971]